MCGFGQFLVLLMICSVSLVTVEVDVNVFCVLIFKTLSKLKLKWMIESARVPAEINFFSLILKV